MAIRVFVAGGTGWAGSALCRGISKTNDLVLAGALSRTHAGKNLSTVLGLETGEVPIYADIDTALRETDFDVFVEYTKPAVGKANVISALKKSKSVVVGTSGLTNDDYVEIEHVAHEFNSSVLAVGNFSITAFLLLKFAEMAAKLVPNYEIIDYAHEHKIDCPSGTARELAYRLSKVQESAIHVPLDSVVGQKESRGARLNEVQVHSIRLPGHVISVETIFGLKDEKLILRHDAGSSAEPYVRGALLAIRQVGTFKGLRRGLDSIVAL